MPGARAEVGRSRGGRLRVLSADAVTPTAIVCRIDRSGVRPTAPQLDNGLEPRTNGPSRGATVRAMKPSLATVLLLLAFTPCVTPYAAERDITIASGKLAHHRFSNELFRIHELWIGVAEDTEFHRWLSQGIDRNVALVLRRIPLDSRTKRARGF